MSKTKIELTEWEKGLVKYLVKNKDKRNLIIATIPQVSSSGMSRQIKLATFYKGEFTNFTFLAAKLLDKKLTNKDAIRVSGCGMDMIFHTLEVLYSSMGEKQAWNLNAVQNYRYF